MYTSLIGASRSHAVSTIVRLIPFVRLAKLLIKYLHCFDIDNTGAEIGLREVRCTFAEQLHKVAPFPEC